MRGKRAKELRKLGIEKDWYSSGFHIIELPKKYNTLKDNIRYDFSSLTPVERLVYAAYQINTLREIATTLRKHHEVVRRIYKRACRKLRTN